MPFVQGQLLKQEGQHLPLPLQFTIQTECAHCGQPIHLEMDGELNYRVLETEAEPLVFVPMVDFDKLEDPSIIDAF
jgi:hypothetical protein